MSITDRTHKLDLEPILNEVVDWRFKSFPGAEPVAIRSVGEQGWNLFSDFTLPVMALKASALAHNIEVVATYCGKRNVSLAPHAKTTMSPQLVQRQLNAGAWAITAATMSQIRVWREFRAARIVLANQVVDPAAACWLAAELTTDPDFDFYCLVDSTAGVRLLDKLLDDCEARRPVQVLVELGFSGGRTGARSPEEAVTVAQAVAQTAHLTLVGVEAFEGLIHREPDGSGDPLAATIAAVDRLLGEVRALTVDLDRRGLFAGAGEIVVSAGGSGFPDRVVEILGGHWNLSRPVRPVLRSGCYLTHDAAHYRQLAPFGTRLPHLPPLREALEVWGAVLSLPEPELVIVGFGKRDVSYDLDLPIPQFVKQRTEPPRPLGLDAAIFDLNDQHAYMKVPPGHGLRVGDLIGCGISHPCTAFDKWRLIPVVGDDHRVVDAVLSYF